MKQIQYSTDSQQSSSVVEVGFALFKEISLKKLQSTLHFSSIKHILTKQNWRIKEKPFQERWTFLFQVMNESLCKRLFIESIGYEGILNSIQQCNFTHLTVLNLSHNPIANIESLTYLNAPNLQFLFLQTNNITSAKILSKIYFQNLEELDLSGNKLKQITPISRLKTNKQSKSFSVEIFTFGENHHHHHWHQDEHFDGVQDISMIAKMEHLSDSKNVFSSHKKYDMLKRQFEYLLMEMQSEMKFINSLTQKRQLQAISSKFCW